MFFERSSSFQFSLIKISLFFFTLAFSQKLVGQNLTDIGKQRPLKITGGITSSQQFNSAKSHDPFSYILGANLNFDFYGWNLPISFSYSNQSHAFQQPFNQYGISPVYKWITLYAGYRSMSFSSYTYSDSLFRGIGLELSPDIGLKISIFYGRLQKAIQADTLGNQSNGIFKRIGYGLKLEYNNSRFSINTILFRAKDMESSLVIVPVNSNTAPSENLALSLGGNISIIKGLVLSLDLASSAFTSDTRSPKSTSESGLYSTTGDLFVARNSSDYYMARKGELIYSFSKTSIGLNYEKVDPGYKTLGGFYFNDDKENYTITFSQNLWKDKLSINTNSGYERNNLDGSNANGTQRLVFAGNFGFTPSQSLNVHGSYSNFKTYIKANPIFMYARQIDSGQEFDSLNYKQVSKSANLGAAWTLRNSGDKRKSVNVNAAFQENASDQSTGSNQGSANFSEAISYMINWLEKELSLSASINSTQSKTALDNMVLLSPNISVNKAMLNKKMRMTLAIGYNRTFITQLPDFGAFNFRFSNNFSLKKKHNFYLNMAYFMSSRSAKPKTGNINARLGYSLGF